MDFWVFAYGSLIWQPDFVPAETVPAQLHGWHRAMCILSTVYRGCPAAPGLVLGLDRGGSCRGLAYRVAADQVAPVRRALDQRELVTGVYQPRFAAVRLSDGTRIVGYAYMARRDHHQYAGALEAHQAAALIRQGLGSCGSSRDYLASTVAHLDALGLPDKSLDRLLHLVDAA
jgi:cation transport protein ChaC